MSKFFVYMTVLFIILMLLMLILGAILWILHLPCDRAFQVAGWMFVGMFLSLFMTGFCRAFEN